MSKFTRDDVDKFYDYDIDIPHRTLYMGSVQADYDGSEESGTDVFMAERILKGLHILNQIEGEITIIMNNLGGDWYHGMAIYDAIKTSKNPVTIKVFGHAMSMGSIILQAAHKRVLAPNAKVMIHYGSMGMHPVHTKTFMKWAKEVSNIDEIMEDIYLKKISEKHPDFSRQKLKSMLNFDK